MKRRYLSFILFLSVTASVFAACGESAGTNPQGGPAVTEAADTVTADTSPETEDDTHGAWFEIRCRHAGAYSMTLVPPEGVKIATEHTQKETAGVNMINLHYTVVDGVKIWRFMNTHSGIPA